MREKIREVFRRGKGEEEEKRREEQEKQEKVVTEIVEKINRVGEEIWPGDLKAFLRDDVKKAREELDKIRDEFLEAQRKFSIPYSVSERYAEAFEEKQKQLGKLEPSKGEFERIRNIPPEAIKKLPEGEQKRIELERRALDLVALQRKIESDKKLGGRVRENLLKEIEKKKDELRMEIPEVKDYLEQIREM